MLSFDAIERHVPESGRIVDLCCGYGALSMLIALRNPDREVLGVDIDPGRVATASSVAAGIPNLRFAVGDLLSFDAPRADAILLIDSLHYFGPAAQLGILRSLRRALTDDGVLICREAVREFHPRFWWNWLHERVMTGLSFTQTRDRSLHFRTLDQMRDQLAAAGFVVERVERNRPLLPYADRLFVARAVPSAST